MIKHNNIWSFPMHIAFEMVPSYSKKLEEIPCDQTIVFDLSRTKNIHSSFIGFLIDSKRRFEKEGGGLKLYISPEIEKIFIKRNLVKYLPYNCEKKSA